MKKVFIALLFPGAAALLLSGCGESEGSTASGISNQTVLPLFAAETGTPETTALTTCSTLKTFAEITSMPKITFAEITRMQANGNNFFDFQNDIKDSIHEESKTEAKKETERE